MSDLQLSLLALGAVIIAVVILFNWWQERRFMQSVNRFESSSDDVLMDDFHIDPERVTFETESIVAEDRYHQEDVPVPEDVLLEELHTRQAPKPAATPAPAAPYMPKIEIRELDPAAIPEPEPEPKPEFRPEPEPEVKPERAPVKEYVPLPQRMAESMSAPVHAEPHAPRPEQPAAQVPPVVEEAPAPVAQPEPVPEPAPEAAPSPETKTATPVEPPVSTLPLEVDEQIDLIGRAALPSTLDMPAFAQAVAQMPKFDKPVRWFLQDDTGFWRSLTPELPSGHYLQMVASLQLADRAGPISQGALMAFQAQVMQLASSLGAKLAWHGTPDPLEYAIELDQFCIDVDVMVGFHILQGSSGPFAGTKLRGLAESAGMTLHEDGAFHYTDAEGNTLYTLVSQDQRPFKPETLRTVFYRGVSFQLDVPKVASTSDAFNRMVVFARQLEASLDGILVDDNQRALGEIEIEKIRQQLKMIHAKMVARFILPGTPAALRLFS